jgi:plastocyanin
MPRNWPASCRSRRRSLFGRAAAALALGVLLWTPTPAAVAAERLQVVISDLTFHDVPATAHVGDTIEWVNKDILDHTATARDGSFDVRLPHGKSGRTVLSRPGKVAFYCRFHPNMTGEIDVLP